jgi:hypothetical protein
MSDNNDLRGKIDRAKRRLPLPELMAQVGLGDRAKKTAHCPFHSDEHKSFSVFQGDDGFYHWKCHAGCGDGDEIMVLSKLKELSLTKAMNLYLEIAGFPAHRPGSREYPKLPEPLGSPKSLSLPESLCVSCVSVSEGQGLNGNREKALKAFGVRNACTERNTARKRRWQLERDEGDTLNKALEAVSKLSVSELPLIQGYANAPENWRRLVALHRELSRSCANGPYFLSYRNGAKVCDGLSEQKAYTITGALVRLGVIEIVRKGKAGLNSGKAAEFRYLLPQAESVLEVES